MKILLTGASGFLGSEIVRCLRNDHELISLGRHSSCDISAELTGIIPPLPQVDMVVHAAGLAHVIPGNDNEAGLFFAVNTQGTDNLLNALEAAVPRLFVFISTVAVYGRESGENISEDTLLLGSTPYARSKIKAEHLVIEWGKKHNVNTVILRLPLVSGTNPPGNLKAMFAAVKRGVYFRIGNGDARKSMVAARDVALLLPHLQKHSGIFNLTDGRHPAVADIDSYLCQSAKKPIRRIPFYLIKTIARVGDLFPFLPINSLKLSKLVSTLTFDDSLARRSLKWQPGSALEALSFTE